MVGDQKLFLPAHEDRAAVGVLHREVGLLEVVAHVAEGREASPVDHVLLLCRAPVPGQEAVPAADDLCVEVGREFRPVVREAADSQIAAEMRRSEVDVLFKPERRCQGRNSKLTEPK